MISKFRNRYFFFLDLVLMSLTPIIALALRVDLPWQSRLLPGLKYYIIFSVPIKIAIFYGFGLYRRLWRYASVDALLSILWGVSAAGILITSIVFLLLGTGTLSGIIFPRSLPFIDGLLTFIVIGGTRLSLRLIQYQSGGSHSNLDGKRVLIVGAGDAGQMVAKEIHSSRHIKDNLVGFLDDDPIKIGLILHGVKVLGSVDQLPEIVSKKRIEEVIIAMPTAPGEVIKRVVNLSEESNVPTKTLPGIYELISGEVTVNQLREVRVGDLLRRETVSLNADTVKNFIHGKRVLVTGAGGSIGSEICNQISHYQPEKLFALGHGENSLFVLPRRITFWTAEQQKNKLEIIVADIRDKKRLELIIKRIKPEIIFHAAAHKHVPLMELNFEDAISNNILGTRNLLELAESNNVKGFINISTDKAVEPANTMGMTKRVGELMVGSAARDLNKPFVSVRFGNVLGSRGSVVPFFKEQIANGGPVTITHPEVERYFMTIPEAVQLVLHAAAIGTSDEIFVLDMGEQIKIKDLAEELINLSGLTLGVDIDIVYTGLRPGEKLSEKLFLDNETPVSTEHEKIRAITNNGGAKSNDLHEKINVIIESAAEGEADIARDLLEKLVC